MPDFSSGSISNLTLLQPGIDLLREPGTKYLIYISPPQKNQCKQTEGPRTLKARKKLNRPIVVGILISIAFSTQLGTAHASPSSAPEPPQISINQYGEREVVATVNGQETRYLAPARSRQELQQQIDSHLTRFPGGVQINENEISYADGTFIMTFAKPGMLSDSQAAPDNDCTFNWYCFYDGTNYTYPRGRLSSCGWQDLFDFGWHDRTESVAQDRGPSIYWVQYLNHTSGGHGNDQNLFFTDGTSFSYQIADVAPYRNMADHAVKRC